MHAGLLRLLRMQSFFCTNRNHSVVVHYQFDYLLSTCHTFRNALLTILKTTEWSRVGLNAFIDRWRCRRCLAINEVSQRGPMTGKYIFVLLPCKSDVKQKFAKSPANKFNFRRGYHPLRPPFSVPCHFFFLKSDFCFKIKFVILSTSSTVLDDGVSYCFSCAPPPPPPSPQLSRMSTRCHLYMY